jgi:hypothetical protein
MTNQRELSVWIKCLRHLGRPALQSDEWDTEDPRVRSHAVRHYAVTLCGISIPHSPGERGWLEIPVRYVDVSTVDCRRCRRALARMDSEQ